MLNVSVMSIEPLAGAYRDTKEVHLNVVNALNVVPIMIAPVIVLASTIIA